VVVGKSIADTTIAATVLEFAARVQLQAMAAGTPKQLPPAEARQTKSFLERQDVVDLRWQLLIRQARRHNPRFSSERTPHELRLPGRPPRVLMLLTSISSPLATKRCARKHPIWRSSLNWVLAKTGRHRAVRLQVAGRRRAAPAQSATRRFGWRRC
jgi:hypothetical protein